MMLDILWTGYRLPRALDTDNGKLFMMLGIFWTGYCLPRALDTNNGKLFMMLDIFWTGYCLPRALDTTFHDVGYTLDWVPFTQSLRH